MSRYGGKRHNSLDFEFSGHTFTVTIDSDGLFWTEWEGDGIDAVSYSLLKKKVMIAVQPTQRCAISAMKGRGTNDLRRVTIIGIHAKNGNMLYKHDEPDPKSHGDADTQQAYRNADDFFPVLTTQQVAEWRRLEQAETAAAKAERQWKKAHQIDALGLTRQALKLPPLPKETRGRFDDEDE